MKKILYWLPTLLWMAVIFFLSSQSGSNLQSMFPFIPDLNFGHLIAYFILGIVCYYSLIKTTAPRPFIWIMLIAFFYGLSDEWHQSFVPARTADIFDLARDLIGAGLAIAVIYLIKKNPKLKHKLTNS